MQHPRLAIRPRVGPSPPPIPPAPTCPHPCLVPYPLPRGAPSTKRAIAASGVTPRSPVGDMAGAGRGQGRAAWTRGRRTKSAGGSSCGAQPAARLGLLCRLHGGGTKRPARSNSASAALCTAQGPPTTDAHPASSRELGATHSAGHCPALPVPKAAPAPPILASMDTAGSWILRPGRLASPGPPLAWAQSLSWTLEALILVLFPNVQHMGQP
jgi:hypothetical protein